MPRPLVVLTGFGPFPGVDRNASGELVRSLARTFDGPGSCAPGAVRLAARELPVTFDGAPRGLAALLEELAPERPSALLALGVHREPWFRLERRARARLSSEKPDNDGRVARDVAALAEGDLATDVDLEAAAESLRAGGARDVRLSTDAGGYVCERTYHALLVRARALGVPGLFLHVPPVETLAPAEQAPAVAELVRWLARAATPAS